MFNKIQNELQNISETIKAITGVDVTIVDNSLKRISGTGKFKNKIGEIIPKSSVYNKCLSTGHQYFIKNPKTDPLCSSCFNKGLCEEKAELCMPIKFDNKIVGILGMGIFDEETKKDFLSKNEDFIQFEVRLSSLISTIINEKTLGIVIEHKSSELYTIINSINEGIIVIDSDYKIVTINEYIKKNLQIKYSDKLNIKEILNEQIINTLRENNFLGEYGPFKLKNKNYIINASPIKVKNVNKGIVLIFSDFNKMKESVLKINSNDFISFDSIIGESEALVKAKNQAFQIASEDVSVMLLGESGTGKELFAKAIHNFSKRNKEMLLPINCSVIPESIFESELFGYERGSFTGALNSGKIGKFEIAKDGTLFLDEVGELPLSVQVKLLRVIEEKEIMRVGGCDPIKVNPRIISATNRNLYNMVTENQFRHDLFYRLNVIPIHIPPLRERGFDIIILSRYFLDKFNKIYNKNIEGFTGECENILLNYSFPGNIRELRNLIEYAINFEENSRISLKTIGKKLMDTSKDKNDLTLKEMVSSYEKRLIHEYLEVYGNSLDAKKIVADKLGVSLSTLYRKAELTD